MGNLKIRSRLALVFFILIALILVIATTSIYELKELESKLREVVVSNNQKTRLVTQMSESIHIQSRVMRTITLLDDPELISVESRKLEEARARYDEAAAMLYSLPTSNLGQEIRTRIKTALALARVQNDRVLAMARSNEDEAAVVHLLRVAGPATQALQDVLHENSALQEKLTSESFKAAEAAYANDLWILGTLTSVAVTFGIITAVVISRSITKPITAAVDVARTVAAKDLTSCITSTTRDETGELLAALGQMNNGLREIVSKVRVGAENVSVAAIEISNGNTDLSSRTEQQACALEQTAASTDQLASTIKDNARSAQLADDLASSATDSAAHGSTIVDQVVTTMVKISGAARKIEEIIGVIEGIAFQTNILALNAAVEAARAGEQGRGFAVVADEVRNLAKGAASAAKEIKVLIDSSVHTINEGTELAQDAGEAIRQVVDNILRVSSTVKAIAVASAEQASGIEQVNIAVSSLEQVTQQNAAQVEEAAAAAESLRKEAATLAETVSTFKLHQTSGLHGKPSHLALALGDSTQPAYPAR
ncbi:methyl-accepting chemotaxis protein [Massilia sp. IC2-477]|uniref:methyl-accepting chemotaxis protein n=1 Tax=Massilia sp. IC2-477 TaxID=2887198 RepID=UPI001D11E6A4|nr:methyl-accepting chemotaxis protein [Massilia sp. IC2-477]MCC2958711.1 methyl-accepting chemotaxis protein [Massilia sp. IC2-477]